MVYVLSKENKPLMPCSNAVARLLLKHGNAKVKRREPFTIKLTRESTEYTQKLTLGVDTGSSTIGTAVSKENGDIVYMSEVIVRNDIADKLTQRAKYRRSRRNRKTRYRKARWMNRRNSIKTGRFSPTMRSKLHSHVREIEYIKSILPITEMAFETGTFDPHLMKNPSLADPKIKRWGYQHGANYGYENTRAMVLDRDNHLCQSCKKRKQKKLEVHHIIFRSNGGSDDESNLITLCHSCHTDLHAGKIKPKLKGKTKGTLKHATQMNSIRIQLLKLYPEAVETFGYITTANRHLLGVGKEHFYDACIIATQGNPFVVKSNLYRKKCIPDGDFQQTKGSHSEQRLTTEKIGGIRKFDKVRYFGNDYFVQGKMKRQTKDKNKAANSPGYAILMNLEGEPVKFPHLPRGSQTPKIEALKRLTARSTWIITTVAVTPNIA